MKKNILFLLFIALTVTVYGQEKSESIDYKYVRKDTAYHAYDLHLDKDKSVNLIISSTYQIKNLKKIFIKIGEQEVKVPFKIISLPVDNDSERMTNLAIKINLEKLLANDLNNCNATILFNLEKKLSFELPFDICKIKNLVLKP